MLVAAYLRSCKATDVTRIAGRRTTRGFTLVELVMTMSLVGVVLGSMGLSLVSGQRTEHYAADRAAMLDATRASMARMTKDLRQASVIDPTSSGAHLMMTTFVQGIQRTVIYDISGTQLLRTVSGRSAEIVQTQLATSSIFSYTPDAATANIVTILLAAKPAASPHTVIQLTSEVELHNR